MYLSPAETNILTRLAYSFILVVQFSFTIVYHVLFNPNSNLPFLILLFGTAFLRKRQCEIRDHSFNIYPQTLQIFVMQCGKRNVVYKTFKNQLSECFSIENLFYLIGCWTILKEAPPATARETLPIATAKLESTAQCGTVSVPYYWTSQNERVMANYEGGIVP